MARQVVKPAPTAAAGLLIWARQRAQITQRELAARAGVRQPVVAAYETGRRQPTIPTLQRLLAAAGFDLRMRIERLDDHDAVLANLEAARPKEEQQAWDEAQRAFVERQRDRLRRTRV